MIILTSSSVSSSHHVQLVEDLKELTESHFYPLVNIRVWSIPIHYMASQVYTVVYLNKHLPTVNQHHHCTIWNNMEQVVLLLCTAL